MLKKILENKRITVCLSLLLCMFMVITPVYAWGRKLITKSISGSFYLNNSMKYSLNAVAGITYDGSKITQISDLSFNGSKCVSSITGVTCNIVSKQKSKTFSGGTATYGVTVTRNAMGVYMDKVDYTLKYKTTDSGTPYSLDEESLLLTSVDVSEPYDVDILSK